MGNSMPLAATASDFNYCSITFLYSDTIRIVPASDQVINAVREAVDQHWQAKIDTLNWDKKSSDMRCDIKLKGNPFRKKCGAEISLMSRRMSCQILSNLLSMGWQLIACSNLSKQTDKTTWIFKFGDIKSKQTPHVLCLNISRTDTIKLINANDDKQKLLVVDACKKVGNYESVGGNCDWEKSADCVTVKLNGKPWKDEDGKSYVDGKKVILEIVQRFENIGYQLFATCDLKGTSDSLYFTKGNNVDHGEPSTFMAISLDKLDRIRVFNNQENIGSIVQETIIQEWPNGIQNQGIFQIDGGGGSNVYEFKLKGKPWWSSDKESVASRRLITRLLQKLLASGWTVSHAVDVSRELGNKSTLIMKTCTPRKKDYICIAPSGTDKINLIDASQSVIDLVDQAIRSSYPKGVQQAASVFDNTAFQFKLNGNPWSFDGENVAHSRNMMAHVLKALNDNGWQLVTSCDTSAKYETHYHYTGTAYVPSYHPTDVHCWIFSKL